MALILTSYTLDALVLLITATFFIYKFSIRNFDYWKKKKVLFPKPLPFIGNFSEIFMFRMTIGHYLWKLYNEFQAPYFGMFVLNKPHLVIKDLELIKCILVKDFNYFPDRTIVCEEKCDSLFSKMLFPVKNPEWKYMRTKVTPVFSSGKVKNMFGLINEVAEEMNTYLAKSINRDSIEAKELCAKYSTDVISSCAFGINANSFQFEDAEFRKAGNAMFGFTWKIAICQTSHFISARIVKFFRMPFFEPRATEFLRRVFWATIEEREKTKNKRNDLIDLLIQIRSQSSPNDTIKFEGDRVVAQAAIFFAAGFETTSSTMSFALYEICIHPEIQNKLRKEIKTVIQEHGLTYEAIQNMKYLHMVICETLRKYPVLPFLDRMCIEDYTIPNSDFVIEKGTPVFIPLFGLQYDPKYFPDPDKFDPERFSEANKNTFPSFTYLPFGEGPRNCLGERFGLLASKLGLAQLMMEYELEPNSKTPIPLKFRAKSLLLASDVGLPMSFKKIVSQDA